jgi:hypothetical protein
LLDAGKAISSVFYIRTDPLTASEAKSSMVLRAWDSVRLAINVHDRAPSADMGSISRCILKEYSPVLKAASAASTPAGTSSAIVRDEETAAAAKEPVHTPIKVEVVASGYEFELDVR